MRAYLPWYLVIGYLGAAWAAALGVLLLRWGEVCAARGPRWAGLLLLIASGVGFFAGVPEIWTPGLAGTELSAASGLAILGAWATFRALPGIRRSPSAPTPPIEEAKESVPSQPADGPAPRPWIRRIGWGIAAIGILAVWRWDVPLFFALNRYAGRTPILDGLARLLINDYAVPTALAMLAWGMWLSGDPRRQAAVLRAMAAVLVSGPILELMNALYFRPRPFTDYEVNLLFYHPSDSSFPSNAATVAWAIAVALWTGDRRWGAWAMGLAAGISGARVYGGVHYPLDVVAGALLGAGLGLALDRQPQLHRWSLRLARTIGKALSLPRCPKERPGDGPTQ